MFSILPATRFGHKTVSPGCWLPRNQLLRPNHKRGPHPSRAREGGYPWPPSPSCTCPFKLAFVPAMGFFGCCPMPDWKPKFDGAESGSFEHTNWFTVKEAGSPGSPANDAARTSIYKIYWQPIYFYIRRMGQGPEDAQDLAQEFFARLFEKNYLQSADREKGKFR